MNGAAPSPVLLLCSPRSFSSITTAMLGCHPQLFALPEQNLFLADTVAELVKCDQAMGPERGYLAGLKRAVAQLEFGEQTEQSLHRARAWIERRGFWRTDRMFRWLQMKVAPCALVYKSPRTAMARHSMNRLLAAAPNARYIHLVREPATTINDWVATLPESGPEVNRFVAEIWLQCQETLSAAQRSMRAGQLLRVRGEDVLDHPAESMRTILEWLELTFDKHELQQMQHPEQWLFAGSLPGLRDGDNDSAFLKDPRLRSTPRPRLHAHELGLKPELTQRLTRMGSILGYS